MVREEETLDGENSLDSDTSTESSDSYSYLLRDVENPNNRINEEWEAIERTLYQESGQHVTNPVLLKECKLWRETFPHIRVRGTAVKPEDGEQVKPETSKTEKTAEKDQLPVDKLKEKRDKIKKAVVSKIVERLISKLNLSSENGENVLGDATGSPKSSGTQSETESYFERGKPTETGEKLNKGVVHLEKVETGEFVKYNRSEMCQTNQQNDYLLDDFELDFSTDFLKPGNGSSLWSGYEKINRGMEIKSNLAKNEEILRSGNLTFKVNEKSSARNKRKPVPSDSITSIIKPIEMTKKIDKKYESMLERILENKGFIGNETRRSSKQEVGSYRESLEIATGRRSKPLPKLNNFSNNWMNRGDHLSNDPYGVYLTGSRSDSFRNIDKQSKVQSCRSANNVHRYSEKFMEGIEREIYARGNWDYPEEINYKRPQLRHRYNQGTTARTQKSSSCGDLSKKKIPTKYYNRGAKGGATEKGRGDLPAKNAAKKKFANQNVQLPPIETGIICTEIIGRPKIASRSLPKKYT